MNARDRRAEVRRRYGGHRGYCGVHESEAGTDLEIDHFQPRSVGGTNALNNLVYCCSTCNRLKGDFWPTENPRAGTRRLLHPLRDTVQAHLREDADGRLTALTGTGAFHIERLRLNRPPLIALRQTRREAARLRADLAAIRDEQSRLQERLTILEQELQDALTRIARLLES